MRLLSWSTALMASLCMGLLLWSMALPNTEFPPPVFWVPAGLTALGLAYLWWRSPRHYALLAACIPLGLPMAGEWSAVGGWLAAGLLGMAALRWWIDALRGKASWQPRFQWAVVLTACWLAWGIVSAAGSPDMALSLPTALRVGAIALGGMACGQWMGWRADTFRRWILLAGLGAVLLVAWTWLHWTALSKAAPIPYWQDANFLSAGLAMLLPPFAWLALTGLGGRAPWPRILGIVGMLLLLAAILKFDSRGAWLSLLVAAACIPLLQAKSRTVRRIWLACTLALGLVLILAMPEAKPAQPGSHEPLDRLQSIASTQDFSNRERLLRWTCAWRMALEKPVLGHGPARFAPLFKNYLRDREEVNQIAWWPGWRFGAHSDALNVLAETGFPGLILFLGMLAAWTVPILRRHHKHPTTSWMHSAIVIALATWLVHGQFNDLLGNPCILAWVFMLLGMCSMEPDPTHEGEGR